MNEAVVECIELGAEIHPKSERRGAEVRVDALSASHEALSDALQVDGR